jgi:protein ImuB
MRRIVAIVLPQLACEIARRKRTESGARAEGPAPRGPIGVLLEPDGAEAGDVSSAVLDAVEDEARRYGVRPGQRVTEASALLAGLWVQRVTYGEIDAALGRVAEVALGFGPTAAVELRAAPADAPRTAWGDAPFDTVWLDVTGAAHLAGGEEALLAELEERVGALGHRARLSIAGGPRLAQALARWAPGVLGTPGARGAGRYPIAPSAKADAARAIAPLPVQALPIAPDAASFLMRLGVITVGDLARLPRAKAAARLGPNAVQVLDLAGGSDDAVLCTYTPPREIVESASFEEGVESTEALLFVLRGMASRAAVRLGARGEACSRLEVKLALDRSIAKLRLQDREGDEAAATGEGGSIGFHVDLPAPLASEADLVRAVRARLERMDLIAPAVGVTLSIAQIVPAPRVQLDLSRAQAVDPDSLPALLAELSAEIGPDRLGLLSVEDAHRPEAQSRLVPVTLDDAGKARSARREQLAFPGAWSRRDEAIPPPARLLPAPIPLGKVGGGGMVAIGDSPKAPSEGGDPHVFAIEALTHLMRLDGVEWWTRTPASRDYARAWLVSGSEEGRLERAARGKTGVRTANGEALVYVMRRTGEVFLQGWYE